MPITIQTSSIKYKNGQGTFQSADVFKGEGVPSGGTTGQVLAKASNANYDTEWTNGVADVQVNGTSVVTDGVANVPIASEQTPGVLKTSGWFYMSNGVATMREPTEAQQKAGNVSRVVPVSTQHKSVFYGLAKAAGDTTQSSSSNAVGTYTDAAKSAIQTMLGVNRAFELINRVVIENDIPANQPLIIDTDSNSKSFNLDAINVIITVPNTSYTTMNGYISVMKNGVSEPVGLRFNNFGHASYEMNNLVSFSLARHGMIIADLKSQINSANTMYYGMVKWTPNSITADYIYNFCIRDNIIPAGTVIEIWGHRI